MQTNEDFFLQVAKEAALEAGEIIGSYVGKKHQYKFKNEDQSDYATQADLESEKKIIQILTKNFPDHNIIAEESGKVNNKSEYTWVIDPLDGTLSFAAGMPYFAVSIGLLRQNQPVLGVVYHVTNKELYWASSNKGAYLNGQKIHVNQKKELGTANIIIDFGHKQKRLPKIDFYAPIIKKAGFIYAIGSAVMGQMLVARGIQEALILEAWVWDFAASVVIVREAGGDVTDFEGNEPDWSKDRISVVASNGLVHNDVIKELI